MPAYFDSLLPLHVYLLRHFQSNWRPIDVYQRKRCDINTVSVTMITYNTIVRTVQLLRKKFVQTLQSRKIPHTSPSRARYGASSIKSLKKYISIYREHTVLICYLYYQKFCFILCSSAADNTITNIWTRYSKSNTLILSNVTKLYWNVGNQKAGYWVYNDAAFFLFVST